MTSAKCSSLLLRMCSISFLVLASCSSDSGGKNPTGPGNNETNAEVVESKKTDVGESGGTITLTDGATVVFPAGALETTTSVTVKMIKPSNWFEEETGVGRTVIACEGVTGNLGVPAEVRVPLPQSMTPADSLKVSAGVIDEDTGAVYREPCTIAFVDGKPFAVVRVSHFSSRFVEWLVGESFPDAAELIVPYYNQGSSNYCWATSVQMAAEGARHDEDAEIPGIIGAMEVDEGGITSLSFRFSRTLASLVKTRTSVTPNRGTWDYININLMRDHLKREIGARHRPVALFNGSWSHAVLVVGYSGDTFYIHDPASTTPSAVGYTPKTWNDIAGKMGALDNMVTLSIPTPLTCGEAPVRVNIMPQSIQMTKPSGGKTDPGAFWWYTWDYTVKDGYSFRHVSLNDVVTAFPGTVTEISFPGDIEFSNASRTVSKNIGAWIDITSMGRGGTSYSEHKNLTLPPNSTTSFSPSSILVDQFRDNQSTPTKYIVTISAIGDGGTLDRQTLNFTIESVTPELSAVTPNSAMAGNEVVITGKRFGLLKDRNAIMFNGTPADSIISWKDDAVRVLVPDRATTGPVVLMRGSVASNSVGFTVAKETIKDGSFNVNGDDLLHIDDASLTIAGSWSLTATGTDVRTLAGSNSGWTTHFCDVKKNLPAILAITMDAVVDPSTVTVQESNGGRTVYEYWTVPGWYKYDVHPLLMKTGDFPLTATYSDTGHTLSFTFTDEDNSLKVNVNVFVYRNVTTYDKDGQVTNTINNQYVDDRTFMYFDISPE